MCERQEEVKEGFGDAQTFSGNKKTISHFSGSGVVWTDIMLDS